MALSPGAAARILWLLTLGLLCSCTSLGSIPAPDPDASAAAERPVRTIEIPPLHPRFRPEPLPDDTLREPGLEFRLREGVPETAAPRPTESVVGAPLSAGETAALLERLAPLDPADGRRDGFHFPTASPPPPRTGTLVLAPFPPPDTAGTPPVPERPPARLEVLRVAPTGETAELVPHLTITFSQPMVPLTTVAELEARKVPVRLSPQPPGRWSWVDTGGRYRRQPGCGRAVRYVWSASRPDPSPGAKRRWTPRP